MRIRIIVLLSCLLSFTVVSFGAGTDTEEPNGNGAEIALESKYEKELESILKLYQTGKPDEVKKRHSNALDSITLASPTYNMRFDQDKKPFSFEQFKAASERNKIITLQYFLKGKEDGYLMITGPGIESI